ncbi:MAG TPA: thiol peroxidase [Acidobacteriota bacterium]|nr:thiol peroxidase [Acidobacteriota bacterium]
MSQERADAVTLRGNPFTLVGPELEEGQDAPDFVTIGADMQPVRLSDLQGKVRILSVVPSLDTPVCDIQTRRFNKEAASLDNVKIYTVSMDLPFAQKRWCESAGVKNIIMLSDHRDASFGQAYGTLIKELRLDCRALFVVDEDNKIRHVEYVKEVADQPDYEKALQSVREIAG